MACFLISAAEAAVVKVVETVEEKKEITLGSDNTAHEDKIPLSRKLKWLNYLLIGGAVLLMFEHVWHGEVVPYFPFLTAASNPQDKAQMLREMATVGVTMAALVTVAWLCMLVVCAAIEKREQGKTVEEN